MAKRLNITVDEEVYDFVARYGGDNRSAFINTVIVDYKNRLFETTLIQQMMEDDQDVQIQVELKDWDVVLGDGLESEDGTDDCTV